MSWVAAWSRAGTLTQVVTVFLFFGFLGGVLLTIRYVALVVATREAP